MPALRSATYVVYYGIEYFLYRLLVWRKLRHNHPATQDKIERGTIWVLEQSVFLDRFIYHKGPPPAL